MYKQINKQSGKKHHKTGMPPSESSRPVCGIVLFTFDVL